VRLLPPGQRSRPRDASRGDRDASRGDNA
jgi:hypothetical protein